jgi:hypothetical protein
MDKEEEKPKSKKRSTKYNHSAFAINGTFDDVIKASFLGKPPEKEKTESKSRADKYEEKVKFEGTLEQMIAIAVKPVKKDK